MIGYLEQWRVEVSSTNTAKTDCVLWVIGNRGRLYRVREPRLRVTSRKNAAWAMGSRLV